MMHIAVFADIHGRILLAFKLVDRYQREMGQHIDLILQAGDMGIFPDQSRMDKATVRHAQSDITESGLTARSAPTSTCPSRFAVNHSASICVFLARPA